MGGLRNWVKRFLLNARIYVPALPEVTAPIVSAYRRNLGGPREIGFRALPLLNVPETGLRLDIGGAAGDTVATMLAQAPGAPVVSFEPNPFFSGKMRRRFQGHTCVRVETVALSDKPGGFLLYIPVYRRVAFPELGTLHRVNAENWLCDRIFNYKPDELMILECPCTTETLDRFELAPALIKIDCRCDAGEVLRGSRKTLEQQRPVIILERVAVDTTCLGQLAECGYQSFVWSDHALHEVALGERCDVLATKEQVKRA